MAHLAALVRNRRGMAAVEFGMLAVPMILLFVGGGEMAQAIITSRNVEQLAFTMTNLGSQQTSCLYSTCTPSASAASGNTITTDQLDQIMAASAAIMGNVPIANVLQMTLTEADIVNDPTTGKCCDFTVRWSYQQGNATLRGGANCGTATLTPVDPTATAPAPTNVPRNLMPVAPAVNATTGKLVNPEAVLIADVTYTYQPILTTALVAFMPSMSSTRYIFPRTMGSIVLQAATSSVPGRFTTTNGSGQICY